MFEDENTTPVVEEGDAFMPDGWHEGMDIFNEGSWAETEQGDASAEGTGQSTEETAGERTDAPTTEQTDAPGEGSAAGDAPTTAQERQQTDKLRFKARVDRQDLDVEMDPSELPTMYQKAQATDRYQAKLAQQTHLMEKLERAARSMGHEDPDAFLSAMTDNWQRSEIRRLVEDGVHEEVAKDMVERRFAPAQKEAPAEETQAQKAPTRDFGAEVAQWRDVYPEAATQPIPKEVLSATMDGAKPKSLLAAYTEYIMGQQKAEADKLRKENEVLKQNAAAAARAPVSGATGGGATDTEPEDDFLKGFNKRW